MATVNNTIAVLFPGAQTQDVINASKAYHLQIVEQQTYSLQKDYERYFKPSRYIFHKEEVNVLFVFPDGTAQLVQDGGGMKHILNTIKQLANTVFN